jgi:hypothetical protein
MDAMERDPIEKRDTDRVHGGVTGRTAEADIAIENICD